MTEVGTDFLGGFARTLSRAAMAVVGLCVGLTASAAQAGSLIPAEVGLRGAAMLLCMALLAAGFVAIVAAALLHHRRQGALQSNFHRSVVAEVGWTLVPCLMVAVLVWPAARGALSL